MTLGVLTKRLVDVFIFVVQELRREISCSKQKRFTNLTHYIHFLYESTHDKKMFEIQTLKLNEKVNELAFT